MYNSGMDNIIFHIDVNSAYLSWSALEKLHNGDSVDLRTIPSIIGGDMAKRHGVVLANPYPPNPTASLRVNPSSMPCVNVPV